MKIVKFFFPILVTKKGKSIALFKETERKSRQIGKWPFLINFTALSGIQLISNIAFAISDQIRGEFDPSHWYYLNLIA